jgi:hypothetical protein
MQRRASFSSSPVPTEIQDLAGIRRIHKSQAVRGSWNPTFQKTKGGPPAALVMLRGEGLKTVIYLLLINPLGKRDSV